MVEVESELESFRRQWRAEVSQKQSTISSSSSSQPTQSTARPSSKFTNAPTRRQHPPQSRASAAHHVVQEHDDHSPYASFEWDEKMIKPQTTLANGPIVTKEPTSALGYYEKGVEHESAGRMGDSVSSYRKAFKMDAKVHEAYKKKHFPASSGTAKQNEKQVKQVQPTSANNAATKADAQHASDVPSTGPIPPINVPFAELLEQFSNLAIPGAEPETDLSPPPPCPIADMPHEILSHILQYCALHDLSSFSRIARVCKRFAYLVATEDHIWRKLSFHPAYGFPAMHYRYVCSLAGTPLSIFQDVQAPTLVPDLTPSTYPTYRSQFKSRPRIRFNGCYISTVNYQRPGASHNLQYNWNSPVLIVTYYRYLRFFRDGSAISLLTTTEPGDVVHYLKKENLHQFTQYTTTIPESVMKDALPGRWRLTGSASAGVEDDLFDDQGLLKGPGEYAKEPAEDWSLLADEEHEGFVNIETEGVAPKYMWKMQLSIGSAGRREGTRNNKLGWKSYWNYNRLTDDWAEFGLRHEKAFYFSRVKSYGMGFEKVKDKDIDKAHRKT